MTALVEHLAGRGHQRVMYLEGPAYSEANTHRLEAFQAATRANHIEATTLGPCGPDYLAAGAQAIDDVLDRHPDAVIGFNDLVAIGLITQLQQRGVRPGHDIAVAGFDGSWLCETTTPSLTSVQLPFSHAIRCAIQDVIDLVENREVDALRELPQSWSSETQRLRHQPARNGREDARRRSGTKPDRPFCVDAGPVRTTV